MTAWKDVDDATPRDRRLLLITKTAVLDAADDAHDVLVGYWNAKSGAWVPAVSGGALTATTLRPVKWMPIPETNLTLRPVVGLKG